MSTNDTIETEVEETAVSKDAVADLAAAKAEAKDKPQAEETAQVSNTETVEAELKDEATLTTEVPVEPSKDLDWYKKAYEESTKEALRLKGELDKAPETPPPVVTTTEAEESLTPEQLYIRGKQIEESDAAFTKIRDKYPALADKETYDKFVAESRALGAFIVSDQKRFPSAGELYEKTAVILGLTPDNSEELGAAVKAGAETTRTSSGTPSLPQKSKVTEEMIATNLKMYPSKTRAEIIEELEPHIN